MNDISTRAATSDYSSNADQTGGASVLQRRFRPEDKIRIVLKGLSGELPVSDLCRIEGVPVWLYYQWCLTFLEAGKNGLKSPAADPDAARPAVAVRPALIASPSMAG